MRSLPLPSARSTVFRDILLLVLGLMGIVWFFRISATELNYYWQWYRIPPYLYRIVDGRFVAGPLLGGLWVTVKITAISLVLAFAIGLITVFLRLSQSVLGVFIARVYLELIRNTPLLVQLFFIYFVLAPVFDWSAWPSAVLALSLFEGAYASEILRAGIVSINRGQWEAARSIGLNTAGVYRHVILPQAIRRVLPPLTGQAISLIKDSSLVSTIAIYDLTMRGQTIIADTFLVFEIWFVVAAIYLVLTLLLSLGVNAMDRRMQRQ
ncbi:MAG: amino acid ABC transporter permease [Pseudomonadota bacterium]